MRTFFALCSVVALSSFALTGCLPAAKPLVRVEFPSASPSSLPTPSPVPGLRQFDLAGRVSTPTGPAAGARISIDNTPFQTQADSTGAFRFAQLPANQARSLSAISTGPDGTRYSLRLPLSPSGPQVDLAPLLLSETGSVYGQVSVEGEGAGQSDLTGVLVFLAGTPMGAFTSSAGEYFLSGLAPGSYTLTAYKEGYAPVTGSIVVESGKPASLNLKLASKTSQSPQTETQTATQTATLSGQVQSSAGPLSGVTVHLAGESYLALSDSQGRFKLSGLPAGSFTLVAQREGYLPLSQSISFKAGEKVQKDLLLQAQTESVQGRLRGQLQDSGGQPLSDLEIETIPPTQRVKTNAQGRFELPGLEPGSYYLRARKDDKTQASRFVALDPGQTAEVILRGHALSSALGSLLCDQQNHNQVNVSAPGVEVHVTINNHNSCLSNLP